MMDARPIAPRHRRLRDGCGTVGLGIGLGCGGEGGDLCSYRVCMRLKWRRIRAEVCFCRGTRLRIILNLCSTDVENPEEAELADRLVNHR